MKRVLLLVAVDLPDDKRDEDALQYAADMEAFNCVQIDRYLVPKLAEHVKTWKMQKNGPAPDKVAHAAEALVQWTQEVGR